MWQLHHSIAGRIGPFAVIAPPAATAPPPSTIPKLPVLTPTSSSSSQRASVSSYSKSSPFSLSVSMATNAPSSSLVRAMQDTEESLLFDVEDKDKAQTHVDQQFFAEPLPLHHLASHDDAVTFVACSANLDVVVSASKGILSFHSSVYASFSLNRYLSFVLSLCHSIVVAHVVYLFLFFNL